MPCAGPLAFWEIRQSGDKNKVKLPELTHIGKSKQYKGLEFLGTRQPEEPRKTHEPSFRVRSE